MARRYYDLPPLTTLATFEAAARHLSFKNAALELNVTPGAVSHQIKALEGELGLALFDRRHRGVELTETGHKLFISLEKSFSDISGTLSRLRQSSDPGVVSIAATTAVSSLWLTPLIIRFWKERGDVPINQIVSDNPRRPIKGMDLRIRYGQDPDPDKWQTRLFRDHLVPVCAPAVAKGAAHLSLEQLAQRPLIHLDADDTSWTTWRRWFSELGYHGEIATGMRVNNYTIALQAARDGAGIVLGWQNLIRPLLANHSLVPFGPHTLEAPEGFYVVSAPRDALSENAIALRDWLERNRRPA